MSALHSPRAPWFMLAAFCAAALLLFLAAAGPDLGLILDTCPDPEPAPVKREVRMPIVIETPKSPAPKVSPDTGTAHKTPAPAPRGHASDRSSEKTAMPAPPVSPARPEPAPTKAGTLLSHSLEWRGDRFEAHFRTDRFVTGAKIFFRPSPSIWVVDLPGRWRNAAPRINTIDEGGIARVVIGEHPDFLRVVFHYRESNLPRPAAAPRVTEKDNGFAVVIGGGGG
ncbi:AMIN domain-containing protein [Desulfatitalea tepidiphila]|uniref:AMIN domain-containing protein n=1 Tax=Desulfatitalea tepidiphila TaxID=1185843 RepID=UPI0006B5B559|nr:AMIN domain-containing protein [Desulfatitalea tepidiphila]